MIKLNAPSQKLKIKKIHPDAVLPTYGTPGAAGFDICIIEDITLEPGETKLAKTGLQMDIPVGFEVQIRPRSGLSLKTPLTVKNSPGTIDCDYQGEVGLILHNAGAYKPTDNGYDFRCIKLSAGTKVAQGVLAPVTKAEIEEVTGELFEKESERGEGGFGSTGK